MTARGGDQQIPRPASFRSGAPAPWAGVAPGSRRISLADVRRVCAALPPPVRPEVALPGTRPAAVLVALFEEDGEARLILTKRPDTMPTHQGEIAFPGGKLDETDADLAGAALREAHEEIGLPPEAVEIVAELDHLFTVQARFSLAPFVGLLTGRPDLVPDQREVVRVFDIALSELLDAAAFRQELWDIDGAVLDTAPGPDRPIDFYEIPGETIWGATARILTGFLAHLTRAG
jgi:8-oxo-dGTP pyrophosphatase MutT (NUDIX family)